MQITIIYNYEEGETVKTTTGLNQELLLVFKKFGYWIMKGGRDKKGRSYLIFSNQKKDSGNNDSRRGLNLNDLDF
jgi:hypothetical protein